MPKEESLKLPLVPLLPILSILICVSFMLQYSLDTWIAFGIALVVALVIYFYFTGSAIQPSQKKNKSWEFPAFNLFT